MSYLHHHQHKKLKGNLKKHQNSFRKCQMKTGDQSSFEIFDTQDWWIGKNIITIRQHFEIEIMYINISIRSYGS